METAQTLGDREYSAVREGGAGLIDLSSRGRILVSGADAVMFLNGLITNDMKTLAMNSWMPAVFPNVQGRLLAATRIIHRADGFLIDTEAATHETVLKLLERFTLAGDFQVTDLTSETVTLSLQGRTSAEIIGEVFGAASAGIERDRVVTAQLASGAETTIIRATHTGEDGFDLFVNTPGAESLRDLLTQAGAKSIGEDTFETLRLEAGIARYGVDMDESNVVTETNLDDAVSFTKGCYVGQEIIARIKYRGHVAKKLTGLIFAGEAGLERGVKIFSVEDQEIGRVTSFTFSPKLTRTIALGYLKYDYLAPGTKVRVLANDRHIVGEVAELPFIRGSWLTV